MSRTVTQEDLRRAHRAGVWMVEKPSAFFLNCGRLTGDLFGPRITLKPRTFVFVSKVYRRGRAALLCYIDKSGKVWWSWTHATVYEQTHPRTRKGSQ